MILSNYNKSVSEMYEKHREKENKIRMESEGFKCGYKIGYEDAKKEFLK